MLLLVLRGRHLGTVMNFPSRGCMGFVQAKPWGMQGGNHSLCKSTRSSRTGWKHVHILSAHPLVCTIFALLDRCVAAPSSQFTHSVANIIHRNWGVVEPLAGLLVSTSMLSWMFGSWFPRWAGQEWRCQTLPLKYWRLLFPLQLPKFGNTCKCHCLSGRSFAFPIPWSGGCLSSVSSPHFNVSGKTTDLIFRFCLNRISTYHMLELPVKGKAKEWSGE